MENVTENKIYRITNGELVVRCRVIAVKMKENIEYFEKYNITIEKVEQFESNIDTFESIIGQNSALVEYKSAVESKNNLVDELLRAFKEMAIRVEIHWGKKSIEYKQLEMPKLYHLSVPELYSKLQTNFKFMQDHQEELIYLGLTNEVLEDFSSKLELLMEIINEQSKTKNKKLDNTRRSRKIGNELYRQLGYYCSIGKNIWKGISPAKYDEFKINTTKIGRPKGSKNKPKVQENIAND